MKAKLDEIEPGLPPGVKIVTTYDRSELIQRSIDNLKHDAHRRDDHRLARHPDLPLARPERDHSDLHHPHRRPHRLHPDAALGITSNIMSLGGIAIAIGALVDAAIVVVEHTHKKLEEWERRRPQGRLPPRGHRRA